MEHIMVAKSSYW